MVRTLILSLLLLAAARGAAADETATAPGTPAASAPATTQSVDAPKVNAPKQGAKKQTARTKAGDGKADPAAAAGQAAQAAGDVKMSGMSILGNEDAPKSLVLVPWKSSQLGDMPSVSRLLDSATAPVDKDVFMRELAYYEFKSSSK
ncbi:MAG TPA: hypothetical protein VN967_01315, partial [Burkholderiales bacterium]|nr:hypothetical protein [Burkholderiales bacterium]